MPIKQIVLAGVVGSPEALADVIASKKIGSVSVAADWDALVSMLGSQHYDLVLLARWMAEEAGGEPGDAGKYGVIPVSLPVIIVYSGDFPDLPDSVQRALTIRGYLREPVDTELLETMILRGEETAAPIAVQPGGSGTALESLLDSPEQARKVIAVFRQQVPTMLQQMDELIATADWSRLEVLVHKMKAGYGYVGAQDIHRVLTLWEREIRERQDPSRYEVRALDLRMRTYTLLGELAIRYAAP